MQIQFLSARPRLINTISLIGMGLPCAPLLLPLGRMQQDAQAAELTLSNTADAQPGPILQSPRR